MNKLRNDFHMFFEKEDKQNAVKFVLDKLQNKEIDVITLYTDILGPELNEMKCVLDNRHICIWQEHVKTAIVRTIVECCFPYVIKMKTEWNYPDKGKAVVLCPPEEYHDLGARMVADYLTLLGYETVFVGSNTPYDDFLNAIDVVQPDLIAVSISTSYNLVITKKIISEIKSKLTKKCPIIVGGSAFLSDNSKYKTVGADCCCRTLDEIKKFVLEGGIL